MKEGRIRIALVLSAIALGVGLGLGIGDSSFLGSDGSRSESAADSPVESAGVERLAAANQSSADRATPSVPAEAPAEAPRFPPSPLATAREVEVQGEAESVDTVTAIRSAVKIQSTSGKLDYFTLLQKLTPEEAPQMLGMLKELKHLGYQVADYDRLFWERWAEVDGKAASETMFRRDRRFKETKLSKLAIGTWAKNDPTAASEWLLSQDDIPLREGMTKGLLEGMAAGDPALTQRFIESAELSPEQTAHGYSEVARQYHIQQGLSAVADWHRYFPEDDPNYGIVANATTLIYARAPFVDALAWANQLQGSPEIVASTRERLHARLAYGRPDGLLKFLANDPTADSLSGVASLSARAVDRWIANDPNAMGVWLRENQDVRNYDLVAAPFAEQIASEDVEAAQVWASSLRDDELRSSVKATIARGN